MNFLMTTGAAATLIIIAVLVLLIIIWMIVTRNKFKVYNEYVSEALSGIDVALEKRYNELTKCKDVVKGYAKHEAETLENIVNLRNGVKNQTIAEKQEFASNLDNYQKQINVLAEQYPELKSNTVFNTLMLSINDCEEHLQAARRSYNSNVKNLNAMVVKFPSNIVAKLSHTKKMEYFNTDEIKKQDVDMTF